MTHSSLTAGYRMKSPLQNARRAYNEYLKHTVLPLIGLTDVAASELGFAELAGRLDKGPTREKFCELTVELLEQNLREHHAERPHALALRKEKRLDELREWQETAATWEAALWSLISRQ